VHDTQLSDHHLLLNIIYVATDCAFCKCFGAIRPSTISGLDWWTHPNWLFCVGQKLFSLLLCWTCSLSLFPHIQASFLESVEVKDHVNI